MIHNDYRDSHQGEDKAANYHEKFYSNSYRSVMWDWEKSIITNVLQGTNIGKAISYLDFACGTGRVTEFVSKSVVECVGVDVSEAMLNIARSNNSEINYYCHDMSEKTLFEKEQFDFITAFRFFPNAQHELRVASIINLNRVMSSNGIMLVNNHKNYYSIIYFIARLFRLQRSGVKNRDLERLFSQYGFDVEAKYYYGIFPCSENFNYLPRGVLVFTENLLSRIPGIKRLGTNCIFVVKKISD